VKRPLAAALVLFAASAVFLGKGAWIFAKAQVAQVLLARAWDETRAGSRAVKPWPWADTWPVARLTVPRLGVEEIVLAGGNGQAMAFGPGHLSRSATPGSAGNVVLTGHRDTHFRFLRDLRPGDEILLEAAQGPVRRYRVTGTAVVDFHDRRPLAASREPSLTLITCYPFDAIVPGGSLRYVVRAVASPQIAEYSTRVPTAHFDAPWRTSYTRLHGRARQDNP
jgi:sortase A